MNLRGAAGDASAVADRLFDPEFDLFAWVAAQERQPGTRRWKETVLLPRAPLPPSLAVAAGSTTQRQVAFAPREATGGLVHDETRPLMLRVGAEERRFDGPQAVAGRLRVCDLVVRDPDVGDERAEFRREGAVWLVASSAGRAARLLRNGLPVTRPEALHDRDVVQLGTWRALVVLAPAASSRVDPAPTAPAPGRVAFLVGARRHALDARVVTIGSGADNLVVLEGPGVSTYHAQIHAQVHSSGAPPERYLYDAGSEEGTFVGDERVTVPRRLAHGDRLRFGSVALTYVLGEPASGEPAVRAAAEPPQGPPAAFLVGVEGPLARRALALPAGATLGRGREADVRVHDPLLSRVHARFDRRGTTLTVTDLGSGNGTAVVRADERAGPRLAPGTPHPLVVGELLRLGRTLWRFQVAEPLERALTVEETGDPRSGETGTFVYRQDGPRLEEEQAGAPAVHPLAGDDIGVGRSSTNDVVVHRPDVGRRQFRLVREADTYAIVEGESRYRTRVNLVPLEPGERRPLADGDRIEAASCAMTFRLGTGLADGRGRSDARQEPPTRPRATLRLESAPGGAAFDPLPLSGDGPFVLGRDRKRATLVVPHPQVSRVHAEVRREGGGWWVRDRGSSGGTFVGPTRVGEAWHPLADGALLALQKVVLRLHVERPLSRALPSAAEAFSVDALPGGNPLESDLRRTVQEELDACIGCHDCMRACPLPDAPSVTIGGLNAYALGIGVPSEVVRRFVADCTQCHACVPVCPADLQRSRMVLWNKWKDVPDEGRRLSVQVGRERVEGEETLGDLEIRLASHALLAPLLRPERLGLLGQARVRRLVPGETLLQEGTYPDALWVLLEGSLDVEVETVEAAKVRDRRSRSSTPGRTRMVTLSPGQTAGECALLADQPAEATVVAAAASTVVGLPRYALESFGRRNEAFRRALDRLYLSRSVEAFLRRVPALERFGDEALLDLMAEMEAERFPAGAVALRAADARGTFGLVRRGFVKEVRVDGDATIVANYLRPGDAFGGRDSGRRGVLREFTAGTRAEVLTVREERLRALDARHPGIAAALLPPAGRARATSESGDVVLADAERAGVLQGRGVMVIDTRLCVDCDNCVSACGRRHGTPRLDRSGAGAQVGPWQVPASCFHCADPLCLFCSVDGIVRLPSGEISIVEESCIGCGACAERCPYDNIRMAPREPVAPSLLRRVTPGVLWRWLGLGDGDGEGADGGDAARVAVKCDLCALHDDGPACVRACPTGAAIRVEDPTEFFAPERPRR
jgi:pSer/pThr/pTyr-binding forkhead associated (FHA) protein/Fe-S-cluster-containing hydrogenase component 2/CRP-like cAMP-binding protein